MGEGFQGTDARQRMFKIHYTVKKDFSASCHSTLSQLATTIIISKSAGIMQKMSKLDHKMLHQVVTSKQ